MNSTLNALKAQGLNLSFTKPDGGMAFWLNCHQDVVALKLSAREKGIYFQSEEEFYHPNSVRSLKPNNGEISHIRLGFASQTNEQAQAGIYEIFSEQL
jgi:GntR family transcriptional regulator/MocR family aminotransferase